MRHPCGTTSAPNPLLAKGPERWVPGEQLDLATGLVQLRRLVDLAWAGTASLEWSRHEGTCFQAEAYPRSMMPFQHLKMACRQPRMVCLLLKMVAMEEQVSVGC